MDLRQLDTMGKELAGLVKDRYGLDRMSFSVVVNVVDGETMGALGDIWKANRTRQYTLSPQQVKLLLSLPEWTMRRMLETMIERQVRLLLNRRDDVRDESEGEG
jgi:hypothetical protein